MENSPERALVLGANGFIGSHVVDSLSERGYAVRAFGSFGDDTVRFNQSENVEIYQGNFLNRAEIKDALEDVDYVFHLISTTTPATAEADPMVDIETNIQGSVALFQECVARGGIKRVLYTSSGGTVYGERQGDQAFSEEEPLRPISPYAIGKVTIENYLRYFNVKHGLSSTSFRIANPYGPRQPKHRKQGVIPIFLDKAMNQEALSVLGDGSMVRDYVYVRDIADMMVETLKHNPQYDVYNLGSGKGYSLAEILVSIENVTGQKPEVSYSQDVPSTFIHTSILDSSRYSEEFGDKNLIDLDTGVALTYDYIKGQR